MADGRSNRKNKVIAFIDRLAQDRRENFKALIAKAKMLELEGFEEINWSDSTWTVKAGRLIKLTGKNTTSSSFNFNYSPSLGGGALYGEWADIGKALFTLRFHRKHQSAPNQRNFITALGYMAYSANQLNLELARLTPEVLDSACKAITRDYSEGVTYNLHKAVAEIAGHFDANGLCRIIFKYKYAKMKRPKNAGDVGHKRLDGPKTLETKSDKLIEPAVFKVIGELYQNVPKDHKYRFYVLLLTLLACLGRRFSEISLLPQQKIKTDIDGRKYIEYFPRKISQGDVFTPKRKLYMPNEVLPIVRDVIGELDELCATARDSASRTQKLKGADLSFLLKFDENQFFHKKDLKMIGLNPQLLDSTGWFRKNGYAFANENKPDKTGKVSSRKVYFTTKEGLINYCEKDYFEGLIEAIHIDQNKNEYFLKDLLVVRYQGISSGMYSQWIATQCTHSMMTTFLRYFPELAKTYASSSIEVDFTSHHFRHTLNTLLDEGGLSDLLQTEWFGRSNPKDTKAYQHTSREKRALILREDIKNGRAGGKLVEQVKAVPVTVQDAVLKARVQAVHDVGSGICVHNFAQTPCERHLQCSAECDDYVWAKDDKGRLNEQKRQLALTTLARDTAEERSTKRKPKKSSDWIAHNEKKINTLTAQLKDNGVVDFDPRQYLEELAGD
ncbi:integrase [Thalassomonas actiniarum]|uniref:Integrase n=1 Tax=Thalassomonas actiniarum TaxID=485447 RepID=A0AAE9YSQ2_9GAMM|nr:integrase [Thalassomonas actiniarum]WDD99603.1 integrase [Thalassomonas actiniarum]